jgi:hypothetical protein
MKITGKKSILTIALIALVLCMITPVSAETLTGNLTSTESNVRNYTWSGSTHANIFSKIIVKTPPTTIGVNSIVLWEQYKSAYDAQSPSSATTPITITYGSNTVATGTYGYNRKFTWLGVEQPGYQWVNMNSWNISSLPTTGSIVLNVSYDRNQVYNITNDGNDNPTMNDGEIGFAGPTGTNDQTTGNYNYIQTAPFEASYTVTKPAGYKIQGTVYKLGYQSWAAIYDGQTNMMLVSDGTYNTNNLIFNVPRETIYISVKDSLGYYHNSSVLFAPTSVTPTWTPDPNATPAAGYVRTYFENVDGRTSGQVHNSNLNLKNVQTGAWTNYTADSDGNGYIDTLPNQSIDAYGSASGYTSTTRLGLGAFSEGVYELIMFPTNAFPTPSAGNITLIVIVNDKVTALPLSAAQVRVTVPAGMTYSGTTGSNGQATFTVPNASANYVTASKTGYNTQTEIIVTSDYGPDTLRIELPRTIVNPTATMTPGPGGTVPTTLAPGKNPDGTYQPGYTNMQGQEMLNWLAENGMSLVQLCFMVTVLALLGVKLGK